MKILVAEDDARTREGLVEIFEQEGYCVVAVADGEAALDAFEREEPDVVCLDIMMPKSDGYTVCRTLRQRGAATPVLFISAKSEEIDKVLGLELGADDFIVKPFGVREVVARIRAVTRRCLASRPPEPREREHFSLGDLIVWPQELRARRGEEVIDLSLREVSMLEQFYLNPGRALDRGFLYRKCWGVEHIPNSRTLDQHIANLRKRIEVDPSAPVLIETVHGVGYRYDEPEA